jgi:hypothetical protein
MILSISIKDIPLAGKLDMKMIESASELLTIAKNYAFSPCRWRLAAAFISGMVLTAFAAQAVAMISELTDREAIAPAPGNAPKLYEPGNFPYKTPAVNQITELVYAFSGEAPISS